MASVKWFDGGVTEEYLTVYRHRDEREARVVADLIRSSTQCEAGAAALDVACGAGRHRQCLSANHWTVGVDLSWPLLRVARGVEEGAPLVRADMRALPFASGAFELVVNLFTSFGYFDNDADHQRAIAEIARVTSPNGWFVLDFLNAASVRRTLVPFDRQQVGQLTVEQTRQITVDDRYVQKSVRVQGSDQVFLERVRLFDPKDLAAMLRAAGFAVANVFGDYNGGPITPYSPRAIVLGRRGVSSCH